MHGSTDVLMTRLCSGQSHRGQVELGYLIEMCDLVALYRRHLRGGGSAGGSVGGGGDGGSDVDSAVQVLSKRSGVSLDQVIYGPHSFGSLLSARSNGAAVGFPSAQSPPPGSVSRYFNGAYTTTHYSEHYAGVSATQLELPFKWRSRDLKVLRMYAAYLANAISDFAHAWLIPAPTAKHHDTSKEKSVL